MTDSKKEKAGVSPLHQRIYKPVSARVDPVCLILSLFPDKRSDRSWIIDIRVSAERKAKGCRIRAGCRRDDIQIIQV